MMLRHIYEPKLGQEDEPREEHAEQSFRFEEHSDNLPRDEASSVQVLFKRFGRGERPRNYVVEINWLDMKSLINKFIEIENPHAHHLKRILEIARALDKIGWQSDSEPVEFWEGLLED
jgi:hypothetical protein